MPDTIKAWLYGTHIANLTGRDTGKKIDMEYTHDAIDRWGIGSKILSLSMPLSTRPVPPKRSTSFFRGLLPEGQQLTAIARQIDVAESNTFALLRDYGKDVAGAIYLTNGDEHEPSPPTEYRKISKKDLARLVNETRLNQNPGESHPLGNTREHKGRSLDGYQGKLLVAKFGNDWFMPSQDGSPSTHIAKPPSNQADYPDLTMNEAVTMQWATLVGVTSTKTEIITDGDYRFMVQSRYDRLIEGPFRVSRIHQEDGCQATGTDPSRKYQSHGGPTLRLLAMLTGIAERESLLAQLVFRVVVGDTDAHAKNFSWLHQPDGKVTLAPLYDSQPGLHYVSNSLAQTVGTAETFPQLELDDIFEEASKWAITPKKSHAIVSDTVTKMADTIRSVDLTPANPSAFKIVKNRLDDFTKELKNQ